ncbi:MAG: hypothetical protein WA210_00775 [Burkholderiaceae bacterium]
MSAGQTAYSDRDYRKAVEEIVDAERREAIERRARSIAESWKPTNQQP